MLYSIQANIMPKKVTLSTLRLGGRNPAGDEISFTNYYMEFNGKPYFAICGEFHYSRYPEADWEAEINKMKASGINILATYIFWNHHEEIEGLYDWRGTVICGSSSSFASAAVFTSFYASGRSVMGRSVMADCRTGCLAEHSMSVRMMRVICIMSAAYTRRSAVRRPG